MKKEKIAMLWMKNVIYMLLFLSLLCNAENLLKNPGFEKLNQRDGSNYWKKKNYPTAWWFSGVKDKDLIKINSSEKYSGNFAFKIKNQSGSFTRIGQAKYLPPGKYLISGMVKGSLGTTVLVEAWDKRLWLVKPKPNNLLFKNGIARGKHQIKDGKWHKFEFSFEIKKIQDISEADILLTIGLLSPGEFLVDDVVLEPLNSSCKDTNVQEMIENRGRG